jgi:hypothetical protein
MTATWIFLCGLILVVGLSLAKLDASPASNRGITT